MMNLLNDDNVYKKVDKGFAASEAEKFNKKARKILSKTAKGKRLISFLEELPKTPRMRGLPKVHKPGIPMRPITSGVGSAPHRLAKHLAKPLSNLLGTISQAHLRNSSDLINRIKDINLNGKIMMSFDVKSLFTNVPIEGALRATERTISSISDEDLPINKNDFMELVSMCVRYNCFIFENQEYAQHHGLAMGSPLSAVMASLYMESLEKDFFARIMGRGSHWYRYVDDVLVIMPSNANVNNKLRRLNMVNENIQFTIEEEANNQLPFLDTIIYRREEGTRFSVFRKPTNKEDYIHYLSRHSERTGFFLRVLRICSKEYLQQEFQYIFETSGIPTWIITTIKKQGKRNIYKVTSKKQ